MANTLDAKSGVRSEAALDSGLTESLEQFKQKQSIKSEIYWDRIFFNSHNKYRFFYMSEIDISGIKIDPRIVVREKDDSLINRLTPQIESEGLIEPLTVLDLSNEEYLLLAGQHRYHVCKNLGVQQVPAKVYLNLDLAEQLTLGYMSNEVRKDPPAGRKYGALHEIFNETKRKLQAQSKRQVSEAEVINSMYMTKMPQIAKFKVKEILIGIITDDLIHDQDSLVGKHNFISVRQVPKHKIIAMTTEYKKAATNQFPLLTANNAFYGLTHLVRTSAITQEEEKTGKNFRRNEYENVKMLFDLIISKHIKPWMERSEPEIDAAMNVCRRHIFEIFCKLLALRLRNKGFDIKTKDGSKAPLFTERKIPWTDIFEEIQPFFTPAFLNNPNIANERSLDTLWNRVEYYVIVKPRRMPDF
jgi:hypothetical protein